MHVAVGSQNPVKVEAVREVVEELFDVDEVVSVDAESGVSEMPSSLEEGLTGAENRVEYCLEHTDADLVFGMEAYAHDRRQGMFLSGWTVAMHRDGKKGIGSGGRITLPEQVAERIRDGEELGPVMDDVVGEDDTKRGVGTIGIMTDRLVTRKESFERSVVYALTPFIKEGMYEET